MSCKAAIQPSPCMAYVGGHGQLLCAKIVPETMEWRRPLMPQQGRREDGSVIINPGLGVSVCCVQRTSTGQDTPKGYVRPIAFAGIIDQTGKQSHSARNAFTSYTNQNSGCNFRVTQRRHSGRLITTRHDKCPAVRII